MTFSEKISIEIDGVTARGRARIEPCDFSVRISAPFHWLSGGSHVMSLARMARPFEGEKGMIKAKEQLAELYRLGCFLRDHMEELQSAYDQSRQKIRATAKKLRLNEYTEDKKALRARLKSGEIDKVEYQKMLLKLRERKTDFEKEARRVRNDFFEKNFPEGVSYGNREQILQILDEPNLLFFGSSR